MDTKQIHRGFEIIGIGIGFSVIAIVQNIFVKNVLLYYILIALTIIALSIGFIIIIYGIFTEDKEIKLEEKKLDFEKTKYKEGKETELKKERKKRETEEKNKLEIYKSLLEYLDRTYFVRAVYYFEHPHNIQPIIEEFNSLPDTYKIKFEQFNYTNRDKLMLKYINEKHSKCLKIISENIPDMELRSRKILPETKKDIFELLHKMQNRLSIRIQELELRKYPRIKFGRVKNAKTHRRTH